MTPPDPSLPTRRSSDLHLQELVDAEAAAVAGVVAVGAADGAVELLAAQLLGLEADRGELPVRDALGLDRLLALQDRKSTRLNSSHGYSSYAVFCLKKKS